MESSDFSGLASPLGPSPLPDEEFIQSSHPDSEQSGADLFLTPHPLSPSLSDRQGSNAEDPAGRAVGEGGMQKLH